MTRPTVTACLLVLALCATAQQAPPVDLHLPTPQQAKRYRTGAAVSMGFGLATGIPMLLSKEQNLNDLGKGWVTFTTLSSFALWGCAVSVDLRLSNARKRTR